MFYQDVLGRLAVDGINYVLIGGTAVILHGVPRTTADIDLVIDMQRDNVLKVVRLLTELGYKPRAPVAPEALADAEQRRRWHEDMGMKAFSFWHPHRPLDAVDIVFDVPVAFADLLARAERIAVGDRTLTIASVADLITMKQNTGRAQDASDVEALERLRSYLNGE